MKLILKRPVVTEKSSKLQEKQNKYTFLVDKTANKIDVVRAIEAQFGVKVESVNTMNYDGAMKRLGRFIGRKSAFKKAVVTLKKDEKIQLFTQE